MTAAPNRILKEYDHWLDGLTGTWLFRGHVRKRLLTTSLEYACNEWNVPLIDAPDVEERLIREFRRKYSGADEARVDADIMYCLALMRHHGAPTRLLDFTYSPYIAMYFALATTGRAERIVLAVREDFVLESAKNLCGDDAIDPRNVDSTRNDATFLPLYMDREHSRRFVFAENAVRLASNTRLIQQQGVFLCPGDCGSSFEENLKAMNPSDADVREFQVTAGDLEIQQHQRAIEERAEALGKLFRYTLNYGSLFPGIGGLCKTLFDRFRFFYGDPTLSGRAGETGEAD